MTAGGQATDTQPADVRPVKFFADRDARKAFAGDRFHHMTRIPERAEHHAADALSPEELRVAFAVDLVAGHVDPGDIEAALRAGVDHAFEDQGVVIVEARPRSLDEPDPAGVDLAFGRRAIAEVLSYLQNPLAGPGVDLRMIVERPAGGRHRNTGHGRDCFERCHKCLQNSGSVP